jgi:hypothetical protein
MKKHILAMCVLCAGWLYPQQAIENPAKPLSNNPDRVVELEEEFRVEDKGEDFFFQYPLMPRIFPDSSILVRDSDQLLHFDKAGRFLRNYFKKGQGPGELEYLGNFAPSLQGVIVHGINPSKLIWFDETGGYTREIVFKTKPGLRYVFHLGDKYFFFRSSFPRISGEARILDFPEDLVVARPGSEDLVEVGAFPTKRYVKRGKSGGAAAIPMNSLLSASFEHRLLFVQHTPEYAIKVFDVGRNQVTKIIKRKYKRIETKEDDQEKRGGPILDGKVVTPPRQRYCNDVENIFINAGKLWVQTSTRDDTGRVGFDIFDLEGAYIDRLFIKLPENTLQLGYHPLSIYIAENALLAVEKNQDETYALVKYLLVDKN